MKPAHIKTTAVFARPFRLAGLDEVLPAGEYHVETEIAATRADPGAPPASVLIHLHPSSPGLARSLTVPLEALDRALATDKLSGRPLADMLLDELLADPMVRLVMLSDGVTESDIRTLYSRMDGAPEARRR